MHATEIRKQQIATEYEYLTSIPLTGLDRSVEELQRVLDYTRHLKGVSTTTCCGQPTTHKTLKGIKVTATWEVCGSCRKEYNRQVTA